MSDTYYLPGSCKVGESYLDDELGQSFGDESFCFISSLLPANSQNNETLRTICYSIECDSSKKNIIVIVGSEKIICPSEGGNITHPGYKGILECPKYEDMCSLNDNNIICNEMFDCLSKLSQNDNYKTEYYDYDGNNEKEELEEEGCQ